MEYERPAPGEELNEEDEPTEPRQAASVIVIRGEGAGLEVLLVRRNPEMRFMGGFWVFPGGAVDPREGEGDEAHRMAAVRELAEEAGVEGVEASELVKFSQWITPRQVEIRFDTHFFVAHLPEGATVTIDGSEIVDHRWYTPQAALEAHRADELELVFPTVKHLEQLAAFGSARELVEYAGGREVEPVEPRVLIEGEVARVVLPGEPGYD